MCLIHANHYVAFASVCPRNCGFGGETWGLEMRLDRDWKLTVEKVRFAKKAGELGREVWWEFATLMKIWSQNGAFCHKKGENGGGKWAIENFLKIFRGIILLNGDFISKFVSLWQKCHLKVEFPPLYKSFL